MPEPKVTDEIDRGIIYHNAMRDPKYSPYCGPCPGMFRMKKVEHLYWRCDRCGAEHDERGLRKSPGGDS